jgi:hypothetical protein
MRHIVLASLLVAGFGCAGLHDRHCATTEPCPEKKLAAPKQPEKVAAPAPVTESHPVVAQEIMLVPTMVYRPFIAANPTTPVRMGSNMTVTQPQGAPGPEPVGAPKLEEKLKKLEETCERQQEVIERFMRERGPTIPSCPPPCREPLLPALFRRPLFNRCDVLNHCEPQCEPGMPAPAPTTSPMPMPMPPPEGRGIEASTGSSLPERLQMPARKTTVETIP